VAAATLVAETEGLEAVTMRRVARALGVVPMTLYTYVPGKAELLDLMLDAAYKSMPSSIPRASRGGSAWPSSQSRTRRCSRTIPGRRPSRLFGRH
jgi:AcrR family transcriptional regulator